MAGSNTPDGFQFDQFFSLDIQNQSQARIRWFWYPVTVTDLTPGGLPAGMKRVMGSLADSSGPIIGVFGADGPQRFMGSAGDDRMYGLYGDGTLTGGQGNDRLVGDRDKDAFADFSLPVRSVFDLQVDDFIL